MSLDEDRMQRLSDLVQRLEPDLYPEFVAYRESLMNRGSSDQRTYIIESAKCLLWHAMVTEMGDERYLAWEITYPNVEALQRFLPLVIPEDSRYFLEFYRQRPQEDRDRCDQRAILAFRAGQSYEQEFRIRAADGSLHWMHESVQVETITAGQSWRAVGVCVDITERKLMEEALRVSESRLQQALVGARQGLWDFDCVTGRMYRNPNWYHLLGYQPDEIEDRVEAWRNRIHPDDAERVAYLLWQHLQDAAVPYDIDYRILNGAGEWLWVNDRGSVVSRDPEGKPLRMIGTLQDITERKRAEMAIRESERRFHTLVDDLPTLIWMLDADSRPVLVNRAWCEFMGCAPEEALEFDWVQAVHPDDAAAASAAFAEACEARRLYQARYRMRRADGEYRWLLSHGVPRLLADGAFIGYIGSSQDVTDLKLLHEQLVEAQKLESLGRLASGVAHDFNNLLTAIMGYTELTQLVFQPWTEEYEMLGQVKAAADRAVDMTRQMLMYARRQIVEFCTIDLNTVIRGSYELLRRTIGAQYELTTLLAADTCCVTSNVTQLEQVLFNLVVNARDAMSEGGRILIETQRVALDVEYASRHVDVTPGEYVMFAVSDTGTGIAPEVRDRIFEPFFTTKEAGKGTGLGLATTYGIVKQSHGHIRVCSEVGIGTTFRVYLPHVRQEAEASAIAATEPVLQRGTETILLVDDEPMVRDAAARLLRLHGYQVLEAGNGSEALHLHATWEGRIDLLVTDVVMPLVGGKELAQRLEARQPGLRVLYTSGYTQNAVIDAGVLKPGILLLPKPFLTADLLGKVREALGKF